MRRASLKAVFSVVALFFSGVRIASSQSSAAGPPFHLSGVVLRDDTNIPVPRCRLSIRPEGQAGNRRRGVSDSNLFTAETDPQGRFSFDLPSEGSWQLSASGTGFRTQLYNEHEGFSSAVVLRAGLPAPALVLHLEADSTVGGFVRDEAGEPVRNAFLSLQTADTAQSSVGTRRQRATTDDRGHYEIAGVSPGSYRLSVQATPWYTAGGQARSGDPVFDVVYPTTWYPGVFEADTAGTITLHHGEAKQIDFNLLPVPAGHLRFPEVPRATSSRPVYEPTVEPVENGSIGGGPQISGPSGQTEIGNLAPGLYRVSQPQADGQIAVSFVRVAAGANLAFSAAGASNTADVTFHMQGDDHADRSQINLTDVASGVVYHSSSGGAFGLRRRPPPPETAAGETPAAERQLAVPAGRYQVTLAGDSELYLTSLELKGKAVPGRIVTLPGGSTTLTLNVARGRAHVSGHAMLAGKPLEGAMVLLIPTSFGQPGAIDLLRRDQSNTDGSFELADVIPGNYILLAIDRGWNVNWRDLSTLSRYLLQGSPLSLQPQSRLAQDIAAQAP